MKYEAVFEFSDNLQKTGAFLISFVFLIIYIRSFCAISQSKKVSRKLITICILYVTLYTLRYFGKILVWIIGAENIPTLLIDEILEYALFDLAFAVGHFCFVLLMILRLQIAFKDTIYETSKLNLLILYSLLIINLIVNELYFVCNQVFYHNKRDHRFGVDTYLYLVFILLNILIAAILVYKFNKNVWHLAELTERANRNEIDRNDSSAISATDSIRVIARKVDFDAKHLLSAAIRYTLLCCIPTIFTNLAFLLCVLVQFDIIQNETSVFWFLICWAWVYDLVLFTNFFCIWLSFPFGKRIYYKKYICGHYHHRCKLCCTFIVGFKIFSKDMRSQNELVTQSSTVAVEL